MSRLKPSLSRCPARATTLAKPPCEIEIGLLTGCQDRPYAFGLAMALASKHVRVDVIGGDEVDSPEFHVTPKLVFLNLGGRQDQKAGLATKVGRLAKYYARLLRYAAQARPRILHILWHNKIEYFDRTALLLYYKLRGKRLAFTAHNVNQARRDSNDSLLNRLTLRLQYRLVDHIFVHTQKMKSELMQEFSVKEDAVTVIRHPLNNAFPDTATTPIQAKQWLGLTRKDKASLFFGRIAPYKNLELLLDSFQALVADEPHYRLIIAGQPKGGNEEYIERIKQRIAADFDPEKVILKLDFIPDQEAELYLKGADVLVLPYKDIFQSGVLFLAYSYGLPVIATDIGSFREEIVEGMTGFLCKADDSLALQTAVQAYFASELYKTLEQRRQDIRDYARIHHSWSAVAELTQNVYARILGGQ